MIIVQHRSTGPLALCKAKGSELEAGDVLYLGYSGPGGLLVVTRSYSLPHIGTQILDVEDGGPDSPFHKEVPMEAEFVILRAIPENGAVHG